MLKTGDRVKIQFEGREVEGLVQLASKNGKSLMLSFEAILGGWAGQMAVLQNDKGEYRELVHDRIVIVRKAE